MQGVPGLTGVVGAALAPPASASASGRDYLSAFTKAFGGAFAEGGREELTIVNRNAMEAVAQALERAGGDRTKLLSGLRALDTTLLGVPVRVDANGQAVVSSTLVRIGAPTSKGARPLAVVRSIPGVDQSVGGLLAPELRPASRDVPCRRSAPPAWAR
jgi:ABC-type branched-subunit amino acid transport system substrate-binding protein